MSFVDLRNFKTNKKVILFYSELESRSRNLNINVKVGVY